MNSFNKITPYIENTNSFNKITHGFVIQRFKDGKCYDSEFVAGDECEYEDSILGLPIEQPEYEYEPFFMRGNGNWFNMVGNPIDGFRLIGPFFTDQDAIDWQDGCDESCWLIEVESP